MTVGDYNFATQVPLNSQHSVVIEPSWNSKPIPLDKLDPKVGETVENTINVMDSIRLIRLTFNNLVIERRREEFFAKWGKQNIFSHQEIELMWQDFLTKLGA